MSREFKRLELWDKPKAAGGVALGAVDQLQQLSRLQRIGGETTLQFAVPLSEGGLLAERRIVRTIFGDDTWAEYRLLGPWEEARTDQQQVMALQASGLSVDLSECGPCYQTRPDGTVTYVFEALGLTIAQHWATYIQPTLAAAGLSYVALNPATPFNTQYIDLTYNHTTPWDALTRLAAEAKTELRLVANGTTAYDVKFETIGASLTTAIVRLSKNLKGIKRTRTCDQQATRVIPVGTEVESAPTLMDHAQWAVAGVSGNTLRLEDPAGGPGALAYDDQLNGYYVKRLADGVMTQITDGVASTNTITVSSIGALANGDLVEVRLLNTPAAPNGDGTLLTYLESPADKATYGLTVRELRRPDLPGTVNWVTNPVLRTWASGVPSGWAKVGTPTVVTQTTTGGRWQTGNASARVQTTSEGEGLVSPWFAIYPTTNLPHVSMHFAFWLDGKAGRMRVELELGIGGTLGSPASTKVYPNGQEGLAFSSQTNTWVQVGVAGIDAKAIGATQARVRIVQDGAGVTSSVTSISNSGTTATVTQTAHGYVTGDLILIAGASLAANNGVFVVTNTGTNSYTYTMGSAPGSNPTGTITATRGSDAYVDRAQLSNTATQMPFVDGSGGTKLWQAANVALLRYARPTVRYDIEVLDLYRLDAGYFPLDELQLGQTVSITDEELNVVATTRTLELREDLLADTATGLVLSDRPDDLLDVILGRLPPPRTLTGADTELSFLVSMASTVPLATPTQLSVTFVPTPATATVYWWIDDAGTTPPRIGLTQAGAPSATRWGTYTGVLSLDRVQTSDLQIYAYCELGNKVSTVFSWRLDKLLAATLTAQITQITSPANGMKVSWTPNQDVAWVEVYTRRATTPTWPTVDGAQASALSSTYFRGRYPVDTTQLGWAANGGTLYGALSYSDTTAYPWANGDDFCCILVPIDRLFNRGTRVEVSGTYATTPPGSITSFDWGSPNFSSSSYSQVTLSWALANCTDGNHDLKLYYRMNGGDWTLITTVTSPVTTTTQVWQGGEPDTSGKFDPLVTYEFKAELYDTVPALIDTHSADTGVWSYTYSGAA